MQFTKTLSRSITSKTKRIFFAIASTEETISQKSNNYYNPEILHHTNSTKEGEGFSNLTDEEFKHNVALAKKHCFRGDVFQLVLSRRFTQGFKGDEFNVYRALRSINPSPYLFFFDYGDFKIFGSSPEAQIIVKNRKAEIHPNRRNF
jgi:anthranilate/para-aminobenzoate synthase component I